MGLAAVLHGLLTRWAGYFERAASNQAVFLMNELPERWIGLAISPCAALSLFLELAIIRWQATVFPFFSFYKNLSLLSCFAGLGLGYWLGRRDRMPLFLTLPLLCWQFLFMIGMRYGMTFTQFQSLYVLPFREQLNMGLRRPPPVLLWIADLLRVGGCVSIDGPGLHTRRTAMRLPFGTPQ